MPNSLYFNNKDSYEDLDLLFSETPHMPFTIEDVENVPIDIRNGTVTRKLGAYKDKSINVKFKLKTDNNNYYSKIDEIIEWLNIIGDSSLIFSFNSDKKFIVKSINEVSDIQRQVAWDGEFELTFICEPFKYPLLEDNITLITISSIYNIGNVYSEPYFKVYCTGNLILTINGNSITLNNISGYIELDVLKGLVYKDIYNYSYMDSTNGKFENLRLKRGKNIINLSNNITKVEIKIRIRYLIRYLVFYIYEKEMW
ncbi:phage tail family protein [Clostridium sp. YIM B02505]|uniref:Phage tail family protein n=1 Tax=Clostridium yunnanense TaxID=2800325 RepID=A0ABS1EJ00_9CLOT|nr:distal tail protein Dit [Clostridium yunnanense]MBK1809339.1 phage tail family protein [Clostridium yunnanense]